VLLEGRPASPPEMEAEAVHGLGLR